MRLSRVLRGQVPRYPTNGQARCVLPCGFVKHHTYHQSCLLATTVCEKMMVRGVHSHAED